MRSDDDFQAEINAHIEIETDRLIAEGVSAAEARALARRRFGNATRTAERFHDATHWSWLEDFFQDLRYGLRTLRLSPGFAAIALASLALGIGANTAAFSLLDALVLKSLPVRAPEQLRVLLWQQIPNISQSSTSGYGAVDPKSGQRVRSSFSYPAYLLFRDNLPQFTDVVGFVATQFTLTVNGSSDFSQGQYVSGNYFTGLGSQPILGRPILPEDDGPGKPPVAVITHYLWEKSFGLDPSVLGRQVIVNHSSVTIVGVMGLAFQGLYPGQMTGLFLPLSSVTEFGERWYKLAPADNWWVQVFGRMRPGALETAAAEAAHTLLARSVESYAGSKAVVPPVVIRDGANGVRLLRDRFSRPLLVLAAVVGFVLLIACANLANLLLARSATRQREFAIRLSIGAGRGRLIRQLLAESLLLAFAGAALGVTLAAPLRAFILRSVSGSAPLSIDARTDGRTLLFTLALGVLTTLLFGLIPAFRASRIDLTPGMRQTARQPRIMQPLIAAQVALSLLLLFGAALFVRTLAGLYAVDLGLRTDHLLTFQTDLSRSGRKGRPLVALYERVQDSLSAIPGVTSVATSSSPMLSGWYSSDGVSIPGLPEERRSTYFLHCSWTFPSTYGLNLRLGRMFTAADGGGAPAVAIVNETFTRRFLPGQNPIGQIYYRDRKPGPDSKPVRIIGVVRDAHYDRVRDEVSPTAYYVYSQWPEQLGGMTFAIRSSLPAGTLSPLVRRAAGGVDPAIPVAELQTQNAIIDHALGTERLFAALVSSFGALAALLAAIGLYGVLAYTVTRRTAEIGIRVALGATRPAVQWLVIRESLWMVLAGIAAGIPTALALSKFVEKQLYGVKPADPASIATAVVAMLLVAAIAAWIPARRASRIDPNQALRCD